MDSYAEAQDGGGEEAEDASGSQASMSEVDAAGWNEGDVQLPWTRESDDMCASMVVEPPSPGEHSPAISRSGSARSSSPNPGVVYWISSMRVASPLPISYHFLQTPLRLSPQFEHCRGDPASHLVVPDRCRLAYMMEQLAREYAPAHRSVSPPRFGAC
ncbi:uncharacterized protein SETTUDRAFT_169142, partial [Exserohilum turcica Et28A]